MTEKSFQKTTTHSPQRKHVEKKKKTEEGREEGTEESKADLMFCRSTEGLSKHQAIHGKQ